MKRFCLYTGQNLEGRGQYVHSNPSHFEGEGFAYILVKIWWWWGGNDPPSPLATQLPTALQGGKGVKVTYFIVS